MVPEDVFLFLLLLFFVVLPGCCGTRRCTEEDVGSPSPEKETQSSLKLHEGVVVVVVVAWSS